MIRINLYPEANKKKAKRSRKMSESSKGISILVMMLVGWGMVGGVVYFAVKSVEEETVELRKDLTKLKRKVDDLRQKIDEERLQKALERETQLEEAINKLKDERRTPVYVMHEMANILSSGKLPEIDEEKQRQREANDPQARLSLNWDASSVWLETLKENKGGTIEVSGAARDATDISEFVKRMRASARFRSVSHAEFQREQSRRKGRERGKGPQEFSFNLSAHVNYWD